MRWLTATLVLGLCAGCSSPRGDDERRTTGPPPTGTTGRTDSAPGAAPPAGEGGGGDAPPAAEPVEEGAARGNAQLVVAPPPNPILAALDAAAKQLEAPMGALDRAGWPGGTGREGETRRILVRVVNRTSRRLDITLLAEQLVTRLGPVAASARLEAWPLGGVGPEEPATGDRSAPVLLVGDVHESVTEGEEGRRSEVTVGLRLIDPVGEKVLAVGLSGTPGDLGPALAELRRKLIERGSQGWPAAGKPRVRVGKLVNKTRMPHDLSRLGPWLEEALLGAGLEVAPDRVGQETISEAMELDMTGRGPTWSPRGADSGYVLQGEVGEAEGASEVAFHLVSTSPAKVVLSVRQRLTR